MVRRSEIRASAEEFWQVAGGRTLYGSPVDVGRAAQVALPLVIKKIPGLAVRDVRDVVGRLRRGGAPTDFAGEHRLHGCLYADLDVGILFVDEDDDQAEQRVTIAHEVAHFVLHYLEPRKRAAKAFGAGIIAVLDRTRPPTTGERLSATMRGVPLAPWVHGLERKPPGREDLVEAEADDLAIELLAPIKELRALPSCSPSEISQAFGLPVRVSERVFQLLRPSSGTPGVVHLFRKV